MAKENFINVNAVVENPSDRDFRVAKPIGGKIRFDVEDNTFYLEVNKTAEPADMTELKNCFLSRIVAKRNNKTGAYSIVFNKTAEQLTELGKKKVKSDLMDCVDCIFKEI